MPPEADELAAQLDDLAGGRSSALDELRELARGVHPAVLAAGGLCPALKPLARRSSVPVRLDVRVVERLAEPIEIAAYYVVSEALTNTAKHAKASHAEVIVREVDGTLHLTVSDDGVGGAHPQHVSGLIGLHDRVEALGGAVDVTSPPGEGTVIQVLLPVHPTDDPPRLPPRAG